MLTPKVLPQLKGTLNKETDDGPVMSMKLRSWGKAMVTKVFRYVRRRSMQVGETESERDPNMDDRTLERSGHEFASFSHFDKNDPSLLLCREV